MTDTILETVWRSLYDGVVVRIERTQPDTVEVEVQPSAMHSVEPLTSPVVVRLMGLRAPLQGPSIDSFAESLAVEPMTIQAVRATTDGELELRTSVGAFFHRADDVQLTTVTGLSIPCSSLVAATSHTDEVWEQQRDVHLAAGAYLQGRMNDVETRLRPWIDGNVPEAVTALGVIHVLEGLATGERLLQRAAELGDEWARQAVACVNLEERARVLIGAVFAYADRTPVYAPA